MKKLTRVAVMGADLTSALSAQAALDVYTDRAAFQAALAGEVVDDLNDVADGHLPGGMDRGADSFTMDSFRCASGPGQCGDNVDDGMFYPA